jgi:glycosyltransferase involved in cell wall biosynthesis
VKPGATARQRKPIHLLLVSPTESGPYVGGADRDWISLLNALGGDNVRVTWVGKTGSEELRKYVDGRVLTRTIDLPHPCFYGLVTDNADPTRSKWLWTKIVVATALAVGRTSVHLRRALRRDPVDVVVTNTALPLLGAFFARVTRRPHAWNIKEYLDPRLQARRRQAAMITGCSSAVVVPSRVIGEAFASRLHVLPDGGDIEDITSRVTSSRSDVLRALSLPSDLPLVAQVGAISQRKGQHLSAEAFVRLASRGGPPTCSLVFIGPGSAQQRERVVRVLSRAPREWRAVVRFDVSRESDLSTLAAADIVVHPSTFHDAFPNAVREAMTLGKPVIASTMGGMVEMIVDGENGLLIPPGDVGALASALDSLLRSPERRQQLGGSAELFAREHFDIRLRKVAFLDLLTQLATSSDA